MRHDDKHVILVGELSNLFDKTYEALENGGATVRWFHSIKDFEAQNIDPLSYINNLDQVSSYSISERRT